MKPRKHPTSVNCESQNSKENNKRSLKKFFSKGFKVLSFITNMTTRRCGVCRRRDLHLGKYFCWKRTKRNYLHQKFVNPKPTRNFRFKVKKFFFRFALCIRNSHCELLLHNRKLMQILGRFRLVSMTLTLKLYTAVKRCEVCRLTAYKSTTSGRS